MLTISKCKDRIQKQIILLFLVIFLIISTLKTAGAFTDVSFLYHVQMQKELHFQNLSQDKEVGEVGYERTFWTYNFDTSLYYELNATLLAIGQYGCIFMETSCIADLGESIATEQCENIRDEFDDSIYPRITDLAGHPSGRLGDIDGDPRIVILLSSNPAAYYSEVNDIHHEYSNLCEMVYLYYKQYRWNWCLALIAHEFHHLIWFNNEWDEPPFTLEALAQYAMYYAGYLEAYDNIAPQVQNFLSQPGDSLLYWNSENSNDYGSAYLLAFYLAEHYGVDILRKLITEPDDGPLGIEAVLQSAGYNITFNEFYMNWITALTIDEVGFDNNLFGFETFDVQMTEYTTVDVFPYIDGTITLRYYGFHIYKIHSPPDNFTVQIRKSSNQTIGVSVAMYDNLGWHVHQNVYYEADSITTDHLMGHSIDLAYLITSYISNHTPTDTPEYGLGPTTDVTISITPSTCQSTSKESMTSIPTNTTSSTPSNSDTAQSTVSNASVETNSEISVEGTAQYSGIALILFIIVLWTKKRQRSR
ncbi:MAG: hypothetical protein JSV04_10120 [Candidatus Heimdallarchaeota archaeon]|nr:MAG: hypothetical protein JSV04_10120 [Candidatus Heimdallarchaeota archaeon]